MSIERKYVIRRVIAGAIMLLLCFASGYYTGHQLGYRKGRADAIEYVKEKLDRPANL